MTEPRPEAPLRSKFQEPLRKLLPLLDDFKIPSFTHFLTRVLVLGVLQTGVRVLVLLLLRPSTNSLETNYK